MEAGRATLDTAKSVLLLGTVLFIYSSLAPFVRWRPLLLLLTLCHTFNDFLELRHLPSLHVLDTTFFLSCPIVLGAEIPWVYVFMEVARQHLCFVVCLEFLVDGRTSDTMAAIKNPFLQ